MVDQKKVNLKTDKMEERIMFISFLRVRNTRGILEYLALLCTAVVNFLTNRTAVHNFILSKQFVFTQL
jgi:hypothetical protein